MQFHGVKRRETRHVKRTSTDPSPGACRHISDLDERRSRSAGCSPHSRSTRAIAISSALYGMGAGVPRTGAIAAAVLADIDGTGGYAVVYSKHRGRAIRMGGDAPSFFADAQSEERVIAFTVRPTDIGAAVFSPTRASVRRNRSSR
jgi:hypothetical protein